MGKPFHFKQFSIIQENTSMKVGTDAVLLGALANHSSPKRLLDIGCGTGIIGLMSAQRFPEAQVDLLEKDEQAFHEAKLNAENSSFSGRINFIHADFENHQFDQTYDLIVSNPPYHLENVLSDDSRKIASRSSLALDPKVLMSKSMRLLSDDGLFWMISPPAYFENCLRFGDGFLAEQIDIQPKKSREVNRIISCWGKKKVVPKTKDFILRNDHNDYSDAYKKLTRDFHPHF